MGLFWGEDCHCLKSAVFIECNMLFGDFLFVVHRGFFGMEREGEHVAVGRHGARATDSYGYHCGRGSERSTIVSCDLT